jgi:hypothetical protein
MSSLKIGGFLNRGAGGVFYVVSLEMLRPLALKPLKTGSVSYSLRLKIAKTLTRNLDRRSFRFIANKLK